MKTAGVVLDFYDDPIGRVLKETFPEAGSLPSIIKTAHILSEEERGVLRDDAYALILVNEGKVMRKFACVDAGNTALSALYFLKTHESLPGEAVKVAASNLAQACEEFGIPGAETLEKIAATALQLYKRHLVGGVAAGGALGAHAGYTKGDADRPTSEKVTRAVTDAIGGALLGGAAGHVTGSIHGAHRLRDLVPVYLKPKTSSVEKVAVSNATVLVRHVGGGAALGAAYGGHDRFDRSTKKGGESQDRFKYRRIRNTVEGAVKGGLTGGAVGGLTGTVHNAHRDKKFGEWLMKAVGKSKTSAAGASRKRDPMVQSAYVGDESDWASRTNLRSVQGGADSGRVIPSANNMKTAGFMGNMMQPSGQTDMFGQPAIKGVLGAMKDRKAASMAPKTAEAAQGGVVLTDDKKDVGPSVKAPLLQDRTPQIRIVDVTGKKAPDRLSKKASAHTALNGRYSLDSYSDVKKAVEYFGDYWTQMAPEDRHEFAVKTASRAGDLGIEVPDLLARYGSTGYAPDVEAHLANRRAMAPDWRDTYSELQEKRASADPLDFAKALEKVDRASGLYADWGGHICDPYLSTFGGGFAKEAGVWNWMSRVGDYVTEAQLKNLALNGRPLIHKYFDSDTTNGFTKDPIVIFESLPETHKIILARLAGDMNDGLPTN